MQVNMRRGLHIFLTLSLLLTVALPVRAHGSTSIQLPIDAAAEAHAAVIASGAPFADFVLLDDELIGASQYYEVKGSLEALQRGLLSIRTDGATARLVALTATHSSTRLIL